MAQDAGDDLDLSLSNIDAGLRLLSYLQGTGDEEREAVAGGQAFLLEQLIDECAAARAAYEQCRGKLAEHAELMRPKDDAGR